MSDPFSTFATGSSFETDRLRASLRTVLDPAAADRAAERVQRALDQLAALRELSSMLSRARYLARISSRFRTSRIPNEISDRSAIALIAHVGLGVDGERLEDGFGIDGVELGRDLLDARQQFADTSIAACRESAWQIGRYRDPSLPATDRVSLLSHLQGCESCRNALAAAQQADAALLAAIEREVEALPPRAVSSGTNWSARLGPVAFAGGIAVLAVVVLLGASFVSGLFQSPSEPVPLFDGEQRSVEPLDGWLLQVSPVGFLEAVNLATGYKRGLDSGDSSGGFSPLYRVSRTHIAAWRPSDGQREDALTIGRIGEQFSYRMTWNRQFVYWYPSGWLDDDTLLIVKSPDHIPGETERSYVERLTQESRLVAFDANTGHETVLLTGNVSAAFPSPDGSMLAIYQPIDHRWPAATLELRPVDGGSVGDPVIRIENRVIGDGVWLADSSAYVATVIADSAISHDDARQARTLTAHGIDEVALERIDGDGGRTRLLTTTVPESIVPLVSTPDGRSVVYQVRIDPTDRTLSRASDWRCYRISVTGGDPVLLASGTSPERVFRPTWSPDGSTMILPVARAFPLAPDASLDQPVNPNASTLLVFGPDWSPGDRDVTRYSSGRDLHGWLPSDAFDVSTAARTSGSRSLAAVSPDGVALDQLRVGGAASENGAYVLVNDAQSGVPLAWSAAGERPRRLIDGATDRTWFNNGTVTMAVVSEQDGQPGSRIVLNAADITRSAAYLDYRYYDPAVIGGASDRRYALPLVAPTGSIVSFFVIDALDGEIALWLDDGTQPAFGIGSWEFPAESGVTPRVVAEWVSADTLLVAVPSDWRDGVPTTSTLVRLVVGVDGVHRLDELTQLSTVGSSAGIELVEFSLSPDGAEIAYRLRQIDSDGDAEDTLHVASTDDLSRAIEIERGGRGEGLLWSPDGELVIAISRGRVASYEPDGRSREYLSPRGVVATDPVIVGPDLWFNGADDHDTRIWTVSLDEP